MDENIIVRDSKVVFKAFKKMSIGLIKGMPLLFRIVICLAISKVTIIALGIKEIIFWDGWINVTVLTGMVIWQIILYVYIKAYQQEQEDKLTKG